MPQQTQRIGFVGLGAMGRGMVHNLLQKGCAVRVFARKPEAAQEFTRAGAQACDSAQALGRECDLVFLCVSDGAAVHDVLFSPQGVASSLARGSIVVDHSTIAPGEARDIGERLARQGVAFLDAPVSGGPQGATAGTLACMVGGAKEKVDACRDVLGAYCKAVTHVGDVGAGQTVKACNQVAVSACLLGVAEAVALARAQGIDPKLMRDVVLASSGRSFAMEAQATRIIEGDFSPKFRARLMRKDLRIVLETAKAAGVALPVAQLTEHLLDTFCEAGHGDLDWVGIAASSARKQ